MSARIRYVLVQSATFVAKNRFLAAGCHDRCRAKGVNAKNNVLMERDSLFFISPETDVLTVQPREPTVAEATRDR